LDGVEVFEVRHRSVTKANAVRWVRERIPGARLVAVGDDITDEEMFAALDDDDLAIAVGTQRDRVTHARAWVSGPDAVRELLWWMLEVRGARAPARPPPGLHPVPVRRLSTDRGSGGAELVVISNRTPNVHAEGRPRQVGGLVSALEPALRSCDGVWLGWSGSVGDDPVTLKVHPHGRPPRATFDLTPGLRDHYYSGFCSAALWPLLHAFPSRARFSDEQWDAYVEANAVYARFAATLARPTATVWVHDYHLLLVASRLRALGHRGPIGLFLHVPFPPRDIFEMLPWCDQVLDALRGFDLVGFHTDDWADNFQTCARARDRRGGDRSRWPLVSVLPIGVDPSDFLVTAEDPDDEVRQLRDVLGDRKLILGVDRLDYSKGIPERLDAFERLLDRRPEWRGAVTLVQISVPSRIEVPDYVELRQRVENMVGRINGQYGHAGWVPVRYLYRSYAQRVLAQLYRAADVALVTPLRDGLNLVAKEFIAAQDPADPGVLVLSRFAGAAVELTEAILTNPYHADGLAADLDRALQMPLAERAQRHRALAASLAALAPPRWAASFLEHLGSAATSRRDA
ncbi:MAG: trehalose-6-phosphate synthase, partial [Acidobacteriota bacterium]